MSLFAPFRDPQLAQGQIAAIRRTVAEFPGTMTLPFVLVAAILLLLILLPTAKRMGAGKTNTQE